jgi:HK97 family phage prohead protease
MDYKTFNKCELKVKKDLEFEGYASVFGNRDDWDDIMVEGAFKKTIREQKNRIKVLSQHRMSDLIGKPTTLEEDKKGLFFEAKLSNTQLAKDIFTLIKDNVLTEMSIGYNAVKWEWDDNDGVRYLKEVRLWEISPVTWGANEEATITKNYGIMEKTFQKEIKRLEALIESIKNEPPRKSMDPGYQSIIDEIRKYK